MTNLWRCTFCHQETLSHLPLCVHCGPASQGHCEPATTALPGPAIPTPAPEVAESLRKSGFRPTGDQLEPAPALPPTPGRADAQRLDAYKTNLDWAIDCASLKLNRLKPGSSAYKTQAGYLRGLVDARESLISEMGAAL